MPRFAMDAYAYMAALKARGYKEIGDGCYSTVLAKRGSDKVVKISRCKDSWLEYITWANRHGFGGSHAPRVYAFKQYPQFYVAIMERLDCTLKDVSWERKSAVRAQKERGSMGSFFDQFREAFREYATDLHEGNWMLRGDELVLTDPITDPWDKYKTLPTAPLRWRERRTDPRQYSLF